jgi:peptidoglycan/xylan/chitin deacetylase (PgdA/CDA1 family)
MRYLKNLFYWCCWPLSYLFYKRHARPLRVLAYHKVNDASHFEQQLIFLKKKFTVLSLDELSERLKKGVPLPPHSLLLTFDDGDISLRVHALPLLRKYNVPAAVFIISELIDSAKPFWWDHIERYHREIKNDLSAGRMMINALKKQPNHDRQAYLSRIQKDFPVSAQQLTTDDLYDFEKYGFRVANHSHTHPMFDRCTREELTEELNKSQAFFQRSSLTGFKYFVYPNGNADTQAESLLKEFGVRLAFLFDHKLNATIEPLRISRLKVNDYLPLPEFFAKVSGFHSALLNLRQ